MTAEMLDTFVSTIVHNFNKIIMEVCVFFDFATKHVTILVNSTSVNSAALRTAYHIIFARLNAPTGRYSLPIQVDTQFYLTRYEWTSDKV